MMYRKINQIGNSIYTDISLGIPLRYFYIAAIIFVSAKKDIISSSYILSKYNSIKSSQQWGGFIFYRPRSFAYFYRRPKYELPHQH
ncbi:hypothetical protein M2347_000098 [Chryseobacterium sp. H1D6B]|nr:hypothetical protein [Chryseobacterium sp. H1D6B]